MSEYLNDPEEAKEFLPRFKYIYALIAFTFIIFILRLWFLQIFQGEELRLFSERNRFKIKKIQAPRGMIIDRNGQILVDNFPGFEVTITPQYAIELDKTAKEIGDILGIPKEKITHLVNTEKKKNGPFRPVLIKTNLARDEVARLDRLRINHPGLDIAMSIQRTYLMKDTGAQMYGYVGEISKEELPRLNKNKAPDEQFEQGDIVGKNGLEIVYDKELRGESGQDFIQVDARGREITALGVPEFIGEVSLSKEPVPGHTLMLTIDKDVQQAAYNSFINQAKIGGAVAMNPKNGEIVAWVNAPSFDPTEFSKGISSKMWSVLVNDPFKPLRNKVIQDHYPPGSTFKAITALAALSEKLITKNSTVFCPGFYKFGRRNYHCHAKHGHGYVNVTQALEQSCDVFFYKMGLALGIDKLASYARALGLGKKTGINLVNEVPGLVPSTEWKKKTFGEEWQPGENLSNAIGQGFLLTTGMQLAQAFSSFANNGPAYQPHFVKKILDIDGKVLKELQPELKFDPVAGINTNGLQVTAENYKLVREGLWMVGNGARGTAKWLKVPGVPISGKTGTVQLFSLTADQVFADCKSRPIKQRHHGWFVAYAPSDDPDIVVAVLAEHACSGSGGAGPIARDIIESYMQKYHPEKIEAAKNAKGPKTAAPAAVTPPKPPADEVPD
ncbi:MAG: penicillin-binding protein 2 [Bdellovibrionota bacterium]